MKRNYIIPIFVPHLGCPMACTFCNQKKISGEEKQVRAKDVKKIIEYYLKNFKDDDVHIEVAFFGGSFTGIDEKIQNELLEAANIYIDEGKVDSILQAKENKTLSIEKVKNFLVLNKVGE